MDFARGTQVARMRGVQPVGRAAMLNFVADTGAVRKALNHEIHEPHEKKRVAANLLVPNIPVVGVSARRDQATMSLATTPARSVKRISRPLY